MVPMPLHTLGKDLRWIGEAENTIELSLKIVIYRQAADNPEEKSTPHDYLLLRSSDVLWLSPLIR